jgi:hypothetical protein
MILRHTNTAQECIQLTRDCVFGSSTQELTFSTRTNFEPVIGLTQELLFSPELNKGVTK